MSTVCSFTNVNIIMYIILIFSVCTWANANSVSYIILLQCYITVVELTLTSRHFCSVNIYIIIVFVLCDTSWSCLFVTTYDSDKCTRICCLLICIASLHICHVTQKCLTAFCNNVVCHCIILIIFSLTSYSLAIYILVDCTYIVLFLFSLWLLFIFELIIITCDIVHNIFILIVIVHCLTFLYRIVIMWKRRLNWRWRCIGRILCYSSILHSIIRSCCSIAIVANLRNTYSTRMSIS